MIITLISLSGILGLPGHHLEVMISAPGGLFIVCITSVLHRPKRKTIHLLVSEIVLCSTIPYFSSSLNSFSDSFQMKAKATRSINFNSQSSLNGVSFVLNFFKFHFLPFVELLN